MNENILQSFKSESVCIKLLSVDWIIETNLQAVSCWRQHETVAYCPPTCWSFRVGLNENANSFFTTRCCFWSGKNNGFPGNPVHKAALRSETLLYQALQAWSPQIRVMQRRGLEKRIDKRMVWKSLSKNKVKIKAYYKKIKVFYDLACMSACCWGLAKPKY